MSVWDLLTYANIWYAKVTFRPQFEGQPEEKACFFVLKPLGVCQTESLMNATKVLLKTEIIQKMFCFNHLKRRLEEHLNVEIQIKREALRLIQLRVRK